MRYFIDTEFIEDGKTIDLISIGIVANDGRLYYAESTEVDWSKADPWIKNNVIPDLKAGGTLRDKKQIKEEILNFCDFDKYGKPEFWAYYADYDWIVFCQLFGKMIDLPRGYPMYCRDLKQLIAMLGNPKVPLYYEKHNALSDALWVRNTFESLREQNIDNPYFRG